jgi:FMN phosphatase YigB (HAD superfamily)
MSRPLVISDCDEVLLRMVSHFAAWLDEERDVTFRMEGNDFASAMRRKDDGEQLEQREIWRLLREFFDTEMHRQDPVEGSVAALRAISDRADVVVLTNLLDKHGEMRAKQLADVGIHARVFTNQGPKGEAVKRIVDEYQPSFAIFIDDLAQHHESVSQVAPEVRRLHLCGEPELAPHITCAHREGHAHARIDNWAEALPWVLDMLEKETT